MHPIRSLRVMTSLRPRPLLPVRKVHVGGWHLGTWVVSRCLRQIEWLLNLISYVLKKCRVGMLVGVKNRRTISCGCRIRVMFSGEGWQLVFRRTSLTARLTELHALMVQPGWSAYAVPVVWLLVPFTCRRVYRLLNTMLQLWRARRCCVDGMKIFLVSSGLTPTSSYSGIVQKLVTLRVRLVFVQVAKWINSWRWLLGVDFVLLHHAWRTDGSYALSPRHQP